MGGMSSGRAPRGNASLELGAAAPGLGSTPGPTPGPTPTPPAASHHTNNTAAAARAHASNRRGGGGGAGAGRLVRLASPSRLAHQLSASRLELGTGRAAGWSSTRSLPVTAGTVVGGGAAPAAAAGSFWASPHAPEVPEVAGTVVEGKV